MLELENLIATTQPTNGYLGYIFWYSIGGGVKIEREELKRKLIENNLEEDWLPNKIRAVDAFRKATKDIERKRVTSDPKIVENILVREVFFDEKMIQRNIVIERVDQNDKRLGYKTEVAILRLDKKTGTLFFETEEEEIRNICKEIEERYYMYKNYYTSQRLRMMITKLLSSLAPTPLRDSGVIYFVPRSMSERVKNVVGFIRSIGGEAFNVPVIDSKDNRHMVNVKLHDYLDQLLEGIKEMYQNPQRFKKSQIKDLIEETNRAIDDYKNYEKLVESEKELYFKKLSLLRDEVIKLMRTI